jgi:hypothetical protein
MGMHKIGAWHMKTGRNGPLSSLILLRKSWLRGPATAIAVMASDAAQSIVYMAGKRGREVLWPVPAHAIAVTASTDGTIRLQHISKPSGLQSRSGPLNSEAGHRRRIVRPSGQSSQATVAFLHCSWDDISTASLNV